MKRILSLTFAVIILAACIAGCGNAGKAKEQTSSEAVVSQTNGKGTGKVVVYTAGPTSLANAIKEKFEETTGVTMELFEGTTGKILGKLEAEKSNPVADVVVLASWPSAVDFKEKGLTQAYPGAKNADKLFDGWKDNDNHIFGYSGSALGITYNTKQVKEKITDWNDLTDEKWKDKINIPDPSLSGSCMDFVSGYINTKGNDGWNLFEELKANGVSMAGANKEALDPVITGAKSAVMAGVDYMAYSSKAKGEPIDIVYPQSGTVVNPRAVLILKDAKNVENARKVVDFMLSDEGQELVMNAYIIPGRKDIKCTNRANMEDIPLLKYDWNWMTEHQKENNEKFVSIFK